MIETIYSIVTNMSTWTGADPRQFLHHYFIVNGAFTTALLIALAVAAVALLLFYGWIGMQSNRLSNFNVWLVTLICATLCTAGITQLSVIGSDEGQTGFFADAADYAQTTLRPNTPNEAIVQFEQDYDNIVKTMDGACDVVLALDLWNALLTIIVFVALSFGVKGFTRYAISVPM